MAAAEPMTMGSPFGSPSSPGIHGSQPYLPQYLLGETPSLAQSPSGRLWSASTGSPPKASTSFNRSVLTSPQQYASPRPDQRHRELLGSRTKEKAGAPPVQGLLETISSPALDKHAEFSTPTGRVPQFASPFPNAHFHTPGFSTPSHDLSHFDQSISHKNVPSPAQVDPFYTQGDSIRPDEELDDTWVTIFGFPPAATSFILQQFSQYGNIRKHVIASDGNWMHVHYQSRLQAKKALSKNAKVYGGSIMVGVTPCIDKAVMMTHGDDPNASTVLQRSMLEPGFNDSALLGAGDRSLNQSKNTSIRPLTAAYKAAQNEHQVVQSNTPQKKDGVMGKAMHYMFGW